MARKWFEEEVEQEKVPMKFRPWWGSWVGAIVGTKAAQERGRRGQSPIAWSRQGTSRQTVYFYFLYFLSRPMRLIIHANISSYAITEDIPATRWACIHTLEWAIVTRLQWKHTTRLEEWIYTKKRTNTCVEGANLPSSCAERSWMPPGCLWYEGSMGGRASKEHPVPRSCYCRQLCPTPFFEETHLFDMKLT